MWNQDCLPTRLLLLLHLVPFIILRPLAKEKRNALSFYKTHKDDKHVARGVDVPITYRKAVFALFYGMQFRFHLLQSCSMFNSPDQFSIFPLLESFFVFFVIIKDT